MIKTVLICAAFALLLLVMCGVLLIQARQRRQQEWEALLEGVRRRRFRYPEAICAITLGHTRRARKLLQQQHDYTPNQAKLVANALEYLYQQGELEGWQLSLEDIDSLSGWEFEEYCLLILEELGFGQVERTGGSGDQGVDIIALHQGERWAIQCKHYRYPVNNSAVQQVAAGKLYWQCQQAAVLTNSRFTPGAQQAAAANQVQLWDRDKLQEFMGLIDDSQ